MIVKTEDGYALTLLGKQVYEVYVPDWGEIGEECIAFPFGPFALSFERRVPTGPRDDPWNGRVEVSLRVGHWSYELWLGSRKTRLYSDSELRRGEL